ncbi:MAG: substrate-binding domain-containing protein [Coriobacteriia bacterium]|nr:substrate-binding domain-containing protein [Coriobacteriia bacterium]
MRQSGGSPGFRRTAVAALAAVFVLSLATPALASAATSYRSTIRLSSRYQIKAKKLTVSGTINRKAKGKQVTVELRKPGRAYWIQLSNRTISKYGRWSYGYTPKVAGRLYFRARYGSKLSRMAGLTVKRGPGTKSELTLFSTSSVRDAGLWVKLKPLFLARYPEYTMTTEQWLGTGQSLQSGAVDGNADVILAHAPQDEIDKVNGKWAKNRRAVMFNYFMIVGPNTGGVTFFEDESPATAFKRLAAWLEANPSVKFWSRNDNSGTNQAELSYWKSVDPSYPMRDGGTLTGAPRPWYNAAGGSGVGMGTILTNTNTSAGYTLSDRATWLFQEKKWRTAGTPPINVKSVLYNPGPSWVNDYSVLEVVRARNPEGAADFSAWIRGAEAQEAIRTYGAGVYNGQLFYPNAGAY